MATVNDLLKFVNLHLLNPIKYAKVLIQLGHEPLKPKPSHHLLSLIYLSEKREMYPWIGSYIFYMFKRRGLFHLIFTGIGAGAIVDLLNLSFENGTHSQICESMNICDSEIEDIVEECCWKDFSFILLKLSISKISGIFIVYPFKVIMIRQMADFIAEEGKNEWFYNAVRCIYKENGIFGFYKGIIPSLIGDLAKYTLYYFFCRIFRKAFKARPSQSGPQGHNAVRKDTTLHLMFRSITRYICSNLFYPFEIVTTVMMLDGVPLSNDIILSEYHSWRFCWRMLKLENQLYRGYSFLFRNHVKPASLL